MENQNQVSKLKTKIKIVILIGITILIFTSPFTNSKSEIELEIQKPIKTEEPKIENEIIIPIQNEDAKIDIDDEELNIILNSPHQDNEVEYEEPIIFYPLTEEERYIIKCILAGECPHESFEGQCLVAQCIYNAMILDDLTPAEVRAKYKYGGWNPKLENEDPTAWENLELVVQEVFDNGRMATDGFVLWFYNPKYAKSSWHESQKFIIEIGNHRFFAPW